jgi:dTDP-4-dehydrorhamnose reductase
MLGSALYKRFSRDRDLETWGTVRGAGARQFFSESENERLIAGIDVINHDLLVETLRKVRPNVVINAVGLIKQLASATDPLVALPLNSMLPHRLADLCALLDARLLHISSDCVFSGKDGHYTESDLSDAEDLYGKSKFIGEVHDRAHVVTIRTSGIGHELETKNGLLEWFLAQNGPVRGFTRAIFSGLPWVETARVIKNFVLPHPEISGLYHVSAKPISKFDLLTLIADVYGKKTKIERDDSVQIDRSLDSTRFTSVTGYEAPDWPTLIAQMQQLRF